MTENSKSFKQFWQNLFCEFKNDIKFDNKSLLIVILCCFLTTSSIVLSFFVDAFFYISGVISVISIIFLNIFTKNMVNGLSFLLYLFPFSMVLFIPGKNIGFYPLLVGIQVLSFAFEWIFSIVKKQRKIKWSIFIPLVIFIVYVFSLFLIGNFSIKCFVSFSLGALFLFSIIENIEKIKIKETFLFFIVGMLICCFWGLFQKSYPNLENFFNATTALGVYRYSALFPNTNAFTMYILISIGMLSVLYLKRELTIIFYPIFCIFLIIAFSTLSKMTFIVLIAFLISLIIIRVFFFKKDKRKIIAVFSIAITVLIAVFIQFDNCVLTTKRLLLPFQNGINQSNSTGIDSGEELSNSLDGQSKIDRDLIANEFTTGRLDLWKICIKSTFFDIRSALLGKNSGREVDVLNTVEGSPHNSFLQILYTTGLFGFMLLMLYLMVCFIKIAKSSFDISGVTLFVVTVLCFCSLDAFSYIGFILIALVYLAMFKSTGEKNEILIKEEGM